MSLSALSKNLYGSYEPTGAFSIEFRTKDGKTIAEPVFARPPRSYSMTESQRSALQKTLYGGYIGDNGNDFKNFSISGDLNFYSVVTPDSPGRVATDENRSTDGITEFFKLRYMLMRYRDYTMTKNSVIIGNDFSGPALEEVRALKRHVQGLMEAGVGALSDQLDVIWHHYDLEDHFFAKVSSFSYDQDASNVFKINYKVSFEAYMVDSSQEVVKSKPIKVSPRESITSVDEQMRSVGPDMLPEEMQLYNSGYL